MIASASVAYLARYCNCHAHTPSCAACARDFNRLVAFAGAAHTHIRVDYNIVAIVLPSSAVCHMFAAKCCTIREAERIEACVWCVCEGVAAKHLHNCQQQATCNWQLATCNRNHSNCAASNFKCQLRQILMSQLAVSSSSGQMCTQALHGLVERAMTSLRCRCRCRQIRWLFSQCLNYSMYVYHM